MGYQDTRLWSRAFSTAVTLPTNEPIEIAKRRLVNIYLSFRNHAATLAGEIGRDLPTLTVHDISHIDALWEMADLICFGPNDSDHEVAINPIEIFVLGCAFLTHDLAHSKAALDLSSNDIASDSLYRDILADMVQPRIEQGIGTPEPTPEERDAALALFLRERHASAAQTLPCTEWQRPSGAMFLLEDQELRQYLGEAIGNVAASHHWPVNSLLESFDDKIGCPPSLPFESCDLLLVASIMRLADGTHLDSRRAPTFLAELRKPTGVALQHWQFQNNLMKPLVQGDRIVFTSGQSFDEAGIDAWWLCFDTLSYLDTQISSVDALLSDSGRPRLKVRGVAGIEDPRRLEKFVKTKGWIPVDTQIRVGNVASLVLRLGGEQLYGRDLTVPLRELIQNAGDAIQARRAIDPYFQELGKIDVSLTRKENRWVLRIVDDGVGMSETVLTGALIDFGTSFWKSAAARHEFPGLAQSKFASTGRYGIGFFSVFMLGDDVKVLSRRFNEYKHPAKVLHFRNGANSRPVLSDAPEHLRHMSGTTVEITLRDDPNSEEGLFQPQWSPTASLSGLCEWLCPTFPVTVRASSEEGTFVTVVEADDWKNMPAEKLLRRLIKSSYPTDEQIIEEYVGNHAKTMTNITDTNGSIIGRATILSGYLHLRGETDRGVLVMTVGGCRAGSGHHVLGVLQAKSLRASRDRALFIGNRSDITRWAKEQAKILLSANELQTTYFAEEIFQSCGIEHERLVLARAQGADLRKVGLVEFARKLSMIVIIEPSERYDIEQNRSVTYDPNVLIIEVFLNDFFDGRVEGVCPAYEKHGVSRDAPSHRPAYVSPGFETIAETWNVSLESMRALRKQSQSDARSRPKRIAVDQHGQPIFTRDYIILRKSKLTEWDKNYRKSDPK